MHAKLPVIRLREVIDDLQEIGLHIAREQPDAALRFLTAVEEALSALSQWPRSGTPRKASDPTLAGLRSMPVPGFTQYTVFYRVTDELVEVIHVVHGSRDVRQLLPGLDED